MNKVKRLQRIVAVRTTQRNLSAMDLQTAKGQTQHAQDELLKAEQKLQQASQGAAKGALLSPGQMERMDVARTAAREEIAAWQVEKLCAEQREESARLKVEAQQVLLKQSEKLEERAEKENQARLSAAEKRIEDERAGRAFMEKDRERGGR